ncbi:M81 family metallopeptidase [Roseomonas gilardii]|uniref:M81 family metallopeptidase n=1 Tax=Roseomonas gilardii TaxID=257708 RepID=UPI0011A42EB4|nr:M81 family metallopeptidase [Roseomonas gilardii]
MRIFSACLALETNTFSPMPTSYQSFLDQQAWRPGEHPAEPTMQTAAFWVTRRRAAADGYEFIPGSCFWAMPGGMASRGAYERMRDEILAQLRAALPVDAVMLGLHGAMVAQGYDDCEADLLEHVRRMVGPEAVIGVELDPHCHLTVRRCELADIIVLYKEYPHTDFVERGEELLDLVLATLRGRIRPVMSLWDCRLIASFPTTAQPMRGLVDRAMALEGQAGVLSISLGHGFPSGDVPESGARVLVVTDDAKPVGDRLAREFGEAMVAIHAHPAKHFLEPAEALAEGLRLAATAEAPVTIADTSDNAGGGAPSDNTTFLRLLTEGGIAGASVGPIWDPVAVRMAFDAGPGARMRLRIGGKACWASGQPLDAEVEILSCVPEAYQSFAGGPVDLGDAVGIRTTEGVGAVLVSRRRQAMGHDLFSNMGIDPAGERLLVVKSNQHFHASFAPISAAVLYATGDGLLATDYRRYPWSRVARPIRPLDTEAEGRLLL